MSRPKRSTTVSSHWRWLSRGNRLATSWSSVSVCAPSVGGSPRPPTHAARDGGRERGGNPEPRRRSAQSAPKMTRCDFRWSSHEPYLHGQTSAFGRRWRRVKLRAPGRPTDRGSERRGRSSNQPPRRLLGMNGRSPWNRSSYFELFAGARRLGRLANWSHRRCRGMRGPARLKQGDSHGDSGTRNVQSEAHPLRPATAAPTAPSSGE